MGNTYGLTRTGSPLYDLTKALQGVEREEFLAGVEAPCLLEVPLEEKGRTGAIAEALKLDGAPGEEQDALKTQGVSVEELQSLERSKEVRQALIHLLEPREDGEPLVLGRSAECDVVVSASGVSRKQAELAYRLGNWFVKDLESHNGTFLGGERLEPGKPASLDAKSQLWFGSYRTVFLFPEELYALARSLLQRMTGRLRRGG